jgi:glycosyltransferase involved in cell wall biosynthesis
LRILWYSNAPWCGSGYGQQTELWAKKFTEMGHDVAIAAFHGLQGVPLNWHGLTVYPGSAEDIWAQDVMLGHYQRHKADLMITLMDAWVLDADQLNFCKAHGMRILFWQPVDCEPLGALDYAVLKKTGIRPVAISQHGLRQLKEFDPFYVPHAIDTKLFSRADEEWIAESRAKAGFTDRFVIGMNAANQDPVRKGFGEQMAAFRLFLVEHPEADPILLIHTRKATRQGVKLDRLIEVLDLKDRVAFSDQYLTATGLTTAAEIARWYSTLDVFSGASYAEGFGLPCLEAQACGTPVVLTECSASTELLGAGWLVPGQPYWNAGHSAWWATPSMKGIYEAYEAAWQAKQDGKLAAMGGQAREFALQYDVSVVAESHWKPLLQAVEDEIRESDVITMSAGTPSKTTRATLGVVRKVSQGSLRDTSLLISAYKRPDYFRRSLESWVAARGSGELRRIAVALGPSDAEGEQRAVIAEIAKDAPCPVVIFPDSPACAQVPGAHRAYGEGANRIFAEDPDCRFLIFGEEDIVVSDDVFEYFTWGRKVSAGKALAVIAHNARGNGWQRPVQEDDTDADQAAARLVRSFSPWGWGTWSQLWRLVIEPEWDYDCNRGLRPDQHGCDWQMQRLLMRQGLPVLVPDASRSQNIGEQGGIYWNPGDDFSWTQSASFREHRDPVTYRLAK